ncbi:thiaminase/transcriptional activator TenA [Palleronia aestuarii]|uniref:Thiaminase/transcriptional activator TenA n=1 Tax=Palleronia aestuarii TaxID=568105 RepID=A0A2W7NFR4_9RHOB|nr:TenA family protein [Palleronia aestuarii]PZX17017.1 thiaminase/transcriptional activator TenA [Palleronia aestuarii]
MTFTDEAKAATATLQETILTMPFNADLASGALRPEVFRGYIVQDAHYLEGFARGLAMAAARASDPPAIAQLSGSANGAILVERGLHGHYMELYGVTPEMYEATPPSRACDHYVNFLLRTAAIDPFPVAVAALLPCFSIYYDVGHAIQDTAVKDHPYRAWIDTYAGEEFGEAVRAMLALTDRLAAAGDAPLRRAMQAAYAASVWHEWMFWHSAYHEEAWPAP